MKLTSKKMMAIIGLMAAMLFAPVLQTNEVQQLKR